MKRRLLYGTASFLLVGGCNPATTVEQKLAAAFPTSVAPLVVPAVAAEDFTPEQSTILGSWWSFFSDDVLDRLISSGLSLNTQQASKTHLDPKIELISGVGHHYLEYRYVQNQRYLLNEYANDLEDIIQGMERDHEREKRKAERELLDQKAEEFSNQEASLIAEITSLTKLLPEFVEEILREKKNIPQADVTPLFASPANIMLHAPDIIEARMQLSQALPQSKPMETAKVFPKMTFSRFFGIPDDVYSPENTSWRAVAGGAEENLFLRSLKSQYYNVPSYNVFETKISSYVMDVEKLITEFTHIQVQKTVLKRAAEKSRSIYDAHAKHAGSGKRNSVQNDAYKAQLAWLRAEYETSKMLIDMYKKIGIY